MINLYYSFLFVKAIRTCKFYNSLMNKDNKKQLILNAQAEICKKLRGDKSQFLHSSENGISSSIISTIERGLKDPQLTTLFKLAESYNIKASELLRMIENKLPKDFHMIEK